MSEINVTPFVDVMLVLLIVFMVTAPLLTVGIPVDLPKVKASALTDQKDPLEITVKIGGEIFLGDSGAYCIACILSYFIVIEHNVYNNIEFADEIFLIMILPGFELVRLSISRLIKGKNIFDGDLNHLHHILIQNKNSLFLTNLITSSFTIISLLWIIYFKNMYIFIFFALLI